MVGRGLDEEGVGAKIVVVGEDVGEVGAALAAAVGEQGGGGVECGGE